VDESVFLTEATPDFDVLAVEFLADLGTGNLSFSEANTGGSSSLAELPDKAYARAMASAQQPIVSPLNILAQGAIPVVISTGAVAGAGAGAGAGAVGMGAHAPWTADSLSECYAFLSALPQITQTLTQTSAALICNYLREKQARWTTNADGVALSEGRLVAGINEYPATTSPFGCQPKLVTGGNIVEVGQHYWEVEFLGDRRNNNLRIWVGLTRPGHDHNVNQNAVIAADGSYFMGASDALLFGSGKYMGGGGEFDNGNRWSGFEVGDRLGVSLDLDVGKVMFFKNGAVHGPGYPTGVTGPLLFAAQLQYKEHWVRLLPDAVLPDINVSPTELRPIVDTPQIPGYIATQSHQAAVEEGAIDRDMVAAKEVAKEPSTITENPPSTEEKFCGYCSKPVDLCAKCRCAKCQSTYYCSRKCQKMHWKGGHRQECKPMPAGLLSKMEKVGLRSDGAS
jgi:hypothetical protein